MSPFRILGLKRTATVAEVKRAYAARLKKTRPEDDAEAFQRLREAFDSAIAMARAHEYEASEAALDDEPENDTAPSELTHELTPETLLARLQVPYENTDPIEPLEQTATSPETASFDFGRFIEEMQQAAGQDLPSFQRWLENHPDLYSLTLKEQLAWPLMSYLAEAERPLLPMWLAALISFLGLDTVGARHFHLDHMIDEARAHAQAHWLPDAVVFAFQDGRGTWSDRFAFRQLQGKLSPLKRAALFLIPGMPQKLGRMSSRIAGAHAGSTRRVANPEALAFWPNWQGVASLTGLGIVTAISTGCALLLGNVWLILPILFAVGIAWFVLAAIVMGNKQDTTTTTADQPKLGFTWGWLVLLLVLVNAMRAYSNS